MSKVGTEVMPSSFGIFIQHIYQMLYWLRKQMENGVCVDYINLNMVCPTNTNLFVIECTFFCMSFGLKNVKVTYQSITNKIFMNQIGYMLEVYIDDKTVTIIKEANLIIDLTKDFH
ncbi:hypothetical protein CR513_40080, partial [Mucuna pruriens]